MTDQILIHGYLAMGLASALVAGVFQSFSDFVMRGLAQSEGAGMRAMQQINRTVLRSVFLVLLLGLAPVSLAIGIHAGLAPAGSASGWIIAGALLYFAGPFLVTVIGNVPMNKRLDRLTPDEAGQGGSYWGFYAVRWTRLNHWRTIGAAAAAACYLIAAVRLAAG